MKQAKLKQIFYKQNEYYSCEFFDDEECTKKFTLGDNTKFYIDSIKDKFSLGSALQNKNNDIFSRSAGIEIYTPTIGDHDARWGRGNCLWTIRDRAENKDIKLYRLDREFESGGRKLQSEIYYKEYNFCSFLYFSNSNSGYKTYGGDWLTIPKHLQPFSFPEFHKVNWEYCNKYWNGYNYIYLNQDNSKKSIFIYFDFDDIIENFEKRREDFNKKVLQELNIIDLLYKVGFEKIIVFSFLYNDFVKDFVKGKRISKLITTDAMGVLKPQDTEHLKVISCKKIFEDILNNNN